MKITRILTAALAVFVCLLPMAASGKAIILDFHTFLGSGPSSLDFSRTEMGQRLDQIKAMGYRFVTLEDAIDGKIEGNNNVIITIDDGNHSVYGTVKEVFLSRDIKPYLFIYPAIIDQRKFAMTLAQLKELEAAGCGVGAHGFWHEYMTPKAWAADRAKVMMEITRPAPAFDKLLGHHPVIFAYPFGVGNDAVKAELAKAGYNWVFTADTAVVPIDFQAADLDHHAVARTLMFRWNINQVMKKLAELLAATPATNAPSPTN